MRNIRLALLSIFCVLAPLAQSRAADSFDGRALGESARKEFGGMRGSYFVPNRLVNDQLFMGMAWREPNVRLADGNYLVSGCRLHDCTEKSAAVVTPTGTMLAAGLIYSPCTFHAKDVEESGFDCMKDAALVLFIKQKNNRPERLQALRDWAEGALAYDRKQYGERLVGYIRKTDVRIIP